MGKYSDEERHERDFYATPMKAVVPLIHYLGCVQRFVEPFVGDGRLVNHLCSQKEGLKCDWAFDILPQLEPITVTATNDFLVSEQRDFNEISELFFYNEVTKRGIDAIISNPPWLNTSASGHQLDRFINKLCVAEVPVIMLLNGNILNNKSFWHTKVPGRALGDLCYQILPVGRMKWIEGSAHSGKEDCSWFFFHKNNASPPVVMKRN